MTTYAPRPDRIAAIKESVDLEALIAEDAGPPATVRRGSSWHHCPLSGHANGDRNPSLEVDDRGWKCWSGGHSVSRGDALDWIQASRGLSRSATIDLLAGDASAVPMRRAPAPVRARERAPEEGPEDYCTPISPGREREVLAKFVAERKWSPDAAKNLGLQAVRDSHGHDRVRFWWALGQGGPPEHWAVRAVEPNAELRWLNAKGVPLPSPYAISTLSNSGPAVLTEGITDAATLIDAYPARAVAGFPGAAWKKEWGAMFAGRDVLLVCDNDEAGWKLRLRVARDLRDGGARSCAVIQMPEGVNDVSALRRQEPEADAFRATWDRLVMEALERRAAKIAARHFARAQVVEDEDGETPTM
jgi:hypothetical protein